MSRLDDYLALQGYVLEAAHALADAEKRLLTALGQAATLADDERAQAAQALLTEQVEMLRGAAMDLSAWLDGPQAPDAA